LHFAKDAATARALIARGADVNAAGRSEDTPLIQAARRGQKDVLEVLIAAGADLHRVDSIGGGTALDWAVRNGHEECAAVLRAAMKLDG
jgi:uncharacterized protein